MFVAGASGASAWVNRALLGVMLALFVFWAPGILGGALKSAIGDTGPIRHPCDRCVVKWR